MRNLNPSSSAKDLKYWTKQMDPLFKLATYMNSLVAFTLGLFMSLNIQRWWNLRVGFVQGIVRNTRNLTFSVSAALHQPEYALVRSELARRCFLSFRLLFLCAYGQVGEAQLRELCDQGLLELEELRELVSIMDDSSAPDIQQYAGHEPRHFDTCLAEVPWLWNARQCHALFKAGAIPPPMISLLHGFCKDSQNAIESIRLQMSAQLPFSYCHLIAILVQGAFIERREVWHAVRFGIYDSHDGLPGVIQLLFVSCLPSAVYNDSSPRRSIW
jgi:hypothetical protein